MIIWEGCKGKEKCCYYSIITKTKIIINNKYMVTTGSMLWDFFKGILAYLLHAF